MEKERILDRELAELKEKILKMGVMVQGLIHQATDALKNRDSELAKEVIKEDKNVDQLELEIDERCVELIALRQPEASDLRFLMTGSRIANDLERIGDLAEDIAEKALVLCEQELLKPLVDIPKMSKIAEEALAIVLDAFVNRDPGKAKAVWTKEKESDRLRDAVHDELLAIMEKDPKLVRRAIPLLLISRHLERICDHTTNIAEDVVFMAEGRVVKHGGGN